MSDQDRTTKRDQPMPRMSWQEFNRAVLEGLQEDIQDRKEEEEKRDRIAYQEMIDSLSLANLQNRGNWNDGDRYDNA